jgi:hypothetical protein
VASAAGGSAPPPESARGSEDKEASCKAASSQGAPKAAPAGLRAHRSGVVYSLPRFAGDAGEPRAPGRPAAGARPHRPARAAAVLPVRPVAAERVFVPAGPDSCRPIQPSVRRRACRRRRRRRRRGRRRRAWRGRAALPFKFTSGESGGSGRVVVCRLRRPSSSRAGGVRQEAAVDKDGVRPAVTVARSRARSCGQPEVAAAWAP